MYATGLPLVVMSFMKRLVAMNAHTGQRVWEYETGVSHDGRLFVAEGVVIYVWANTVFCLDYQSGALRWKASIPVMGAQCVIVFAGCVVATSMGEAVCLSLANGAQVWHDKFKGYGSASGAIAAPGVAAQLAK